MDTPPAPARRPFDLVAYLKLFRFPLVFTAIADSAAGYFMSGLWAMRDYSLADQLPGVGRLALVSSGLYLFGMSLNDIADRRKDREHAPNKVLPSGRVSLLGACVACGSALAAACAAFPRAGMNFRAGQYAVLCGIVGAIVLYDTGLVKLPPMMGLVRAFNFTMGLLYRGSWDYDWMLVVVAPEFIYVTALTYVSTLEDRELDRVRLRWGVTFMALGLLLAGGGFSLYAFLRWGPAPRGAGHGYSVAVLLLSWIPVAWLARRARAARDKRGVMILVRDGVACIIALNGLLLASAGLWLPGLIVLSLLVPAMLCLALFKRLA